MPREIATSSARREIATRRSLNTPFGSKTFWRRYQISCFACHNGPGSEHSTSVQTPTVNAASATTQRNVTVTIALQATDPGANALTLHIVDPPKHGTAGIIGTTATYIPAPGYTGTDSFTFAAWNGYVESQLATADINIGAGAIRRRAVRR